MKKYLLLTLASTIFAADAYAAVATSPVKLSTVTVVATRTEHDVNDVPGMVSVVDASEPSKVNSSKVSDLLSNATGVEFVGGPLRSGETINIRGFKAADLIITLDGRRQNFESQHDGRFFIDPSLLKKVEVVKGNASALYGSGGLGGVVAFETKDAKDYLEDGKTSGMQFTAGMQTANREGSGVLTGYKVGENFDTVASVVTRQSGSVHLNNDTAQRSDDNIDAGYAKFTYDISQDSKLKFDMNSFYNFAKENANPGAGPVQNSGKNLLKKEISSNQAGLKYSYDPDSKLIDFSTQLYFVDTQVKEDTLEGSALNPANNKLNRELQTFGFNADNKSDTEIKGLGDNLFSYGVETFYNTQNGKDVAGNSGLTGARAGVPDATSLTAGTYLQDEIKFALGGERELVLSPALRFDYYSNNPDDPTLASDTASRLSPKFGTNLKLNKHYNIFGNYAEGFRAPTLTELYADGHHFPIFGSYYNDFAPNPNLKPETSRSFEFGAGGKFDDVFKKEDQLRFKASRYITKASDYIEQVISGITIGVPPCNFPFIDASCSGGTAQFVNVPTASIWGYEGDVSYDNSDIEAKLGVSYVSGQNARTGQSLTTRQPLIVSTNLGYKLDSLDSTIGYAGKYYGDNKRALRDLANEIDYVRPGYATHGIYWSYAPKKCKNMTVDFAIDNLFDKKYKQPFFDLYDMERNYKLRLTYKW